VPNKKITKLNIGCGRETRKDCINVDYKKWKKEVKIVDLNKQPYPFKDNTFDYVYADNVLEHLQDLFKIFNELHRICKYGAIIEVTSPFWLHPTSHSMTHTKNNVSPEWFKPIIDNYYDPGDRYQEIKGKFDLIKYEYIPSTRIVPMFLVNKLANVIPCLVVGIKHYILVKKKPIKSKKIF